MKKRILVIEDDLQVLRSLTKILEMEGYEVKESESAEAIIDYVKKNEFDLVLVDLVLSGMDGIEILKIVKEKNPETVVFILTGYPTRSSIMRAKQFGADDYILKPVTAADLLKRIKDYLN